MSLADTFLNSLVSERGVSGTTRNTYRLTLKAYGAFLRCRGCEIEAAQAEDIQAYLENLAEAGIFPNTIRLRLSVLRQFYRFLLAARHGSDDPVAVIDGPGSGPVPPEALAKMLNAWVTYTSGGNY